MCVQREMNDLVVVTSERADDEIRTRDPHLGKVMRYQLRYIRMHYDYRDVRISWCAILGLNQ